MGCGAEAGLGGSFLELLPQAVERIMISVMIMIMTLWRTIRPDEFIANSSLLSIQLRTDYKFRPQWLQNRELGGTAAPQCGQAANDGCCGWL